MKKTKKGPIDVYTHDEADATCLAAPDTESLNITLAAYALYLATGNTIYSQSIRAATITEYLRASADLIQKLDPVENRDARKTDKGKTYEGISKVITEVKRIETVPNRREGYTLAMHRRLFTKITFLSLYSALCAIFDWCAVGTQGGFRCSEYSQPSSSGLLTNIQLCPLGTPKAFILTDIEFYTKEKRLLERKYAIEHPDEVYYVKVWFRWQKNGDHGIFRWMSRNDERIYLCAVRAWIRIVKRFLFFMNQIPGDPLTKPIAIYLHTKTKQPRYLTSTMVTAELRTLAVEVHGLKDKKDIDRFSSHSLRVGACCIYFAAGYNPAFIQRALRWKSDAWRVYVRDLLCTAHRIVVAMNKADTMPVM